MPTHMLCRTSTFSVSSPPPSAVALQIASLPATRAASRAHKPACQSGPTLGPLFSKVFAYHHTVLEVAKAAVRGGGCTFPPLLSESSGSHPDARSTYGETLEDCGSDPLLVDAERLPTPLHLGSSARGVVSFAPSL